MNFFKYALGTTALISLLTISGCQCNSSEKSKEIKITDSLSTSEEEISSLSAEYNPEFAFYYLDFDEASGEDLLVPQEMVTPEMDEIFIKERLNKTYPKVQITDMILDEDSILNVYIDEATYLTQQMGSYGAQEYLMHSVYAFTDLGKIKAVYFHFEEGDHAEPRLYFRTDFNISLAK